MVLNVSHLHDARIATAKRFESTPPAGSSGAAAKAPISTSDAFFSALDELSPKRASSDVEPAREALFFALSDYTDPKLWGEILSKMHNRGAAWGLYQVAGDTKEHRKSLEFCTSIERFITGTGIFASSVQLPAPTASAQNADGSGVLFPFGDSVDTVGSRDIAFTRSNSDRATLRERYEDYMRFIAMMNAPEAKLPAKLDVRHGDFAAKGTSSASDGRYEFSRDGSNGATVTLEIKGDKASLSSKDLGPEGSREFFFEALERLLVDAGSSPRLSARFINKDVAGLVAALSETKGVMKTGERLAPKADRLPPLVLCWDFNGTTDSRENLAEATAALRSANALSVLSTNGAGAAAQKRIEERGGVFNAFFDSAQIRESGKSAKQYRGIAAAYGLDGNTVGRHLVSIGDSSTDAAGDVPTLFIHSAAPEISADGVTAALYTLTEMGKGDLAAGIEAALKAKEVSANGVKFEIEAKSKEKNVVAVLSKLQPGFDLKTLLGALTSKGTSPKESAVRRLAVEFVTNLKPEADTAFAILRALVDSGHGEAAVSLGGKWLDAQASSRKAEAAGLASLASGSDKTFASRARSAISSAKSKEALSKIGEILTKKRSEIMDPEKVLDSQFRNYAAEILTLVDLAENAMIVANEKEHDEVIAQLPESAQEPKRTKEGKKSDDLTAFQKQQIEKAAKLPIPNQHPERMDLKSTLENFVRSPEPNLEKELAAIRAGMAERLSNIETQFYTRAADEAKELDELDALLKGASAPSDDWKKVEDLITPLLEKYTAPKSGETGGANTSSPKTGPREIPIKRPPHPSAFRDSGDRYGMYDD